MLSEELEHAAGRRTWVRTSAAILRLPAIVDAGTVSWSGRRLGRITLEARVRGRRTVADILVENRD